LDLTHWLQSSSKSREIEDRKGQCEERDQTIQELNREIEQLRREVERKAEEKNKLEEEVGPLKLFHDQIRETLRSVDPPPSLNLRGSSAPNMFPGGHPPQFASRSYSMGIPYARSGVVFS